MKRLREKINGDMKYVVLSGCFVAIFAGAIACGANLNARVSENTTGRKVNDSKINTLKEDVKYIRDGITSLLKEKGR